MPPDWSFFSHINPVALSVIVPSPLSVYERAAPACTSPSLPVPNGVVCPVLSGLDPKAQGAQAHPPLAASAVQNSAWRGQTLSLQATPTVPHSWSTQVQRPPSVPGTNSQKGKSKGQRPPHIA